jgi:hypothetical protein
MSQRERDRLKVLHEVQQGHLTQRAAGLQLGLIPQSGTGCGSCGSGCGRRAPAGLSIGRGVGRWRSTRTRRAGLR